MTSSPAFGHADAGALDRLSGASELTRDLAFHVQAGAGSGREGGGYGFLRVAAGVVGSALHVIDGHGRFAVLH